MIDRAEILSVATDLSLSPEVVEKDYVLGWLLAGIYAQPSLAENWVFKGGTCLKKCYFETYRFSEDLGFTLIDASQLTSVFLLDRFPDVSAWVYANAGIEIPVDLLRFEIYENPFGRTSCQGRIYYSGPLPHPGTLPRIKLDLTADELLALPPIMREVIHPYTDQPEGGISARCYAFDELFGEKVRALGERARPRDLYDVINLFRHSEFDAAAATILDVLSRKCEFKRISLPTVSILSGRVPELKADWENMLGHQLPMLPPFDSFWSELPRFFSWLNGSASHVPLPGIIDSLAASADEEPFNPGIGVLRRQGVPGSSHVEAIRFAAANRLQVDLGYQNSVRRIEPYSLWRSSTGDILVRAVKSSTGEDRSYRLDKIQSARVSDKIFVPRYPIDFSTGARRANYSLSSAPYRSRVSAGPIYIYQCLYCQKKFRRKKQDSTLRPHKTEQSWPCPGRTAYLVETQW